MSVRRKIGNSRRQISVSRTLSGVLVEDDSLPSKSRSPEEAPAQSKLSFWRILNPVVVLLFLLTILIKLYKLLKVFFKNLPSIVAYMITKARNKPAEIVPRDHEALKKVSEPVNFETTTREERLTLMRTMYATLKSMTHGSKLGLAAPQIGINLRAVIVAGIPMFNPEFRKAPVSISVTEGCYSIPKNSRYKVERAKYGWAKWQDLDGNVREEKVHEMKAVILQHEIDHLDGKCCDDVGKYVR